LAASSASTTKQDALGGIEGTINSESSVDPLGAGISIALIKSSWKIEASVDSLKWPTRVGYGRALNFIIFRFQEMRKQFLQTKKSKQMSNIQGSSSSLPSAVEGTLQTSLGDGRSDT
jgi:hypothetical protein